MAETLASFDPPGFPYLDDKLTDEERKGWSKTISFWMNEQIEAGYTDENNVHHPLQGSKEGVVFDRTPLAQFFNGLITPFNVRQRPVAIIWSGFPNLIERRYPGKKEDQWKEADENRDLHDEYLEWTVKKNDKGHITSVTFTCEGPEYWEFLARHDRARLLSIYRARNPEYADQMRVEDFFDSDGNYNPFNQWNGIEHLKDPRDPRKGFTTTNPGCIMHLAQANNTLGAEIDIAAQATVIRRDAHGNTITNDVELCNCSAYGQPKRHSDPQIGSKMNGLARDGNKVSIANPVGIYMAKFSSNNFSLDVDGTKNNLQPVPPGTFTWARGDINRGMGLRLHIEVPKNTLGKDGRQLIVHDIVDLNKDNIRYGGQFAEAIQMCVNGVTISGVEPAPAEPCPLEPGAPNDGHAMAAIMAATPPLEEDGRLPMIKTRY